MPCSASQQTARVCYSATLLTGQHSLVIPGKVLVQAMLVQSDALVLDSRVVSDDNTLGCQVAAFMNDFAV